MRRPRKSAVHNRATNVSATPEVKKLGEELIIVTVLTQHERGDHSRRLLVKADDAVFCRIDGKCTFRVHLP